MIRNAESESDRSSGWLVELVADYLKVPAGELEVTVPLARYGLDSLAAVQLTTAIATELQCDVPDDLLFDCPNLASLETFVTATRRGASATGFIRQNGADPWARMRADARLPDDVHPQTVHYRGHGPRKILLSGATGFLGAYLLAALLDQTEAQVACLVRSGREPLAPNRRLQENLARYGLWRPTFTERVELIPGDVSRADLGLSLERYDELVEEVDTVYHGAAAVNWIYSYAALRDVNVLGTLEMLRFACRGEPKAFHFISSLATCYSTQGPTTVTENDHSLHHLEGLHLGYAQTKCVAESLVRSAARRGLPATIIRPGLILGERRSGLSNPDDLLPAMIRGCVRMGAAPDLDWPLACSPVDHVADSIVALTTNRPQPSLEVFHLAANPQRNWREVVLWLNLFGYRLPLIPYRQWRARLEVEGLDPEHPLHSLRWFFVTAPPGAKGLTLPELHALRSTRRICASRTEQRLIALSRSRASVNAQLLDRSVQSLVDRRLLPPIEAGECGTANGRCVPDHRPWSDVLEPILQRHDGDETLRIRDLSLLNESWEHSIASELTAFRHGTRAGLFRFHAVVESRQTGIVDSRELFVKAKPADQEVLDTLRTVATLRSPTAGHALTRCQDLLGIRGCHQRETAIYGQTDPRFRRHAPQVYGVLQNDGQREWIVVMECLTGLELVDAADDLGEWRTEHIEAAVKGIAEVHAIWYGREPALRTQPWLGHALSSKDTVRMSDWWRAIADCAQETFAAWLAPETIVRQSRLIDQVGSWWKTLERLPRTLIHNDFNPRNVAFRPEASGDRRLCAYDWELACLGLPQRDLAELLCFVLSPDTALPAASEFLEMHRRALEQFTAVPIDPTTWTLGFELCLQDLMLQRLPLYTLIHPFRPQQFLERTVRTWETLFRHFSAHLGS